MTFVPTVALVAAGLPLLAACSLFGGEEETTPLQQLQVVDDRAPFDPAQAVDDDDAAAPAWPRSDSVNAGPGPVTERPADEPLTTPAEVRATIEARRRQREDLVRSGADPRDAKQFVARNPPAEDPGTVKPPAWTAIDWALEATLVVAASGASTLLWVFARRIHGAVWAALAIGLGAAAAFLLLHQE